jgi:hypothetical protein
MNRVRVVPFVWMCSALVLAACGGDDKKLELGGSCTLNSDCADGLLCKFGACHKACVKSIDCAAGERCVQVDGVAVCQASACAPGCPAPLACREVDQTCRNRCTTADDCLGGQMCAGAFCVEKTEADGSVGPADATLPTDQPPEIELDAPVDAGASLPDVPPASADLAPAPTDVASPDSPATSPDTSPARVDAAQTDTSSAGGCGAQDQACCNGTTCNAELACVGGKCTCGESGYACCAGATCNHGAVCAGVRCGCVKTCGSDFYQKTNSTFGGIMSLKNPDGSALTEGLSVAGSLGQGAACVVRGDGTVWCQGDNSSGRLGNGNMNLTSSDTLVQVLIGVPEKPLTGIKKIAMGELFACALGSDGHVWCWGALLGNVVASALAVQVLEASGGASFGEVEDIVCGPRHACVLKKDGTVWCWGANEVGQLGTGAISTSASIPLKVGPLPNVVSALSVGATYATCAVDVQGWPWCWGSVQTQPTPSPARLVQTKGGAPLADVVQIDARAKLLRKSDGSLWDWTYDPITPVAEKGVAVSGAFWLGAGCWIGADGAVRGITPAPTCP